MTVWLLVAAAQMPFATQSQGADSPDIRTIPVDLEVPPMNDEPPGPGRRVRQTLTEYRGTGVYHSFYLPIDWAPGKTFPVFVEYAGNGPYRNTYGDVSTGRLEDSRLGYGLTEGRGWIWLCLPYVGSDRQNVLQWWGDVPATLDYARRAVQDVCQQWGGDHATVVMGGFSRGAIACGYLGLHNDEASDIWLAFFAHSHYDGVRRWPYDGSDREAAQKRLARLGGRASWVSHEDSIEETRKFVETSGSNGRFTWQPLGFHNHTDEWVLRDIPERRAARGWLTTVAQDRPGVSQISGHLLTETGVSLAGAIVRSGATHWTPCDQQGRFVLKGLLPGTRIVQVWDTNRRQVLGERTLVLSSGPLEIGDWRLGF